MRSTSRVAASRTLLIDSAAMEDQVAFSPDGRSIAFMSTASGNADIYVLPFMPEQPQHLAAAANVTNDPGGDFRPDFSPDGARIAFTTDRDTAVAGHPIFGFTRQREGDVYVMDRDGGNLQRLTTTPDWDGSPEWSADGRTLYFYSARPREIVGPPTSPILGQEGGFRIWAMNADGSNPRAVTPEGVEALAPAVTADGRIAYQKRTGFARWSIESVAADGSGARAEGDMATDYWLPDFHAASGAMVVHGVGPAVGETQAVEEILGAGALLAADFPADVAFPDRIVTLYPMRHTTGLSPHPDRNETAVTIENEAGTRLVLADFDGANQRELFAVPNVGIVSGTPNRLFDIKWSDDGDWITYTQGFFFGQGADEADIWVMRADGSERRNLSEATTANEGVAAFSPDSGQLVFRSARNGRFDLFLTNRDGTEPKALTSDEARENFPVFSPSGDTIAFSSNRDGTRDRRGNLTFDNYLLARGAGRHARGAATHLRSSGPRLAPVVLAGRRVDRVYVRARRHQRRGTDGARGRVRPADVRRAVRATFERRIRDPAHAQQVGRGESVLAAAGSGAAAVRRLLHWPRVAGGARAARVGAGAARPVRHTCRVHETARGRAHEHADHDRRAAR